MKLTQAFAFAGRRLSMSERQDGRNDAGVSGLLAGVSKVIASTRYCWLVTEAETGCANARPMGRILPDHEENLWAIRFITDGRSRKVSDIRRAGSVELIFQHDAEDAFVVLIGRAKVLTGASEIRRLWREVYQVYFPSDADRANATFIEVNIERMRLWIRGVTPEPFGLRATVLERDTAGPWRLSSDHG
jgi:general stress protein 26